MAGAFWADATTTAAVLAATTIAAKRSAVDAALGSGTLTVGVYDGSGTLKLSGTFSGASFSATPPMMASVALAGESGAGGTPSSTWTLKISNAGGQYITFPKSAWTFTGPGGSSTISSSDAMSVSLDLAVSQTVGPVGESAANWVLTMEDHFDASSLDGARWNSGIWYGDTNADGTVNYDVNAGGNSLLRVWPALNGSGQFFNRTIDTDGKFTQLYGFFEARMRMPHGKGCFPAFWIFNHVGSDRSEIDIMECFVNGDGTWSTTGFVPRQYAATMHNPPVWGSSTTAQSADTFGGMDLTAAFHTYGLKWDATGVTWLFDGVPWRTIPVATHEITQALYVLFDLWFWGYAGTPDTTNTPRGSSNAFEIDYVRVWEAAP